MPGARDPEPLARRVRLGISRASAAISALGSFPAEYPRTRVRHDDLELRLVVDVRSWVVRVWVGKCRVGIRR